MEELNISTCLICLKVLGSPKNLYDANYKKLLELLLRLLGFQVEIEEPDFNICCSCEGKLIWVEEFKKLCEQSLEKFKKVDCKKEFIDLQEYSLVLQKEQVQKQKKVVESESDNKQINRRPKRRKKEILVKRSTRILRDSKNAQRNHIEEIDLKDVVKDPDNSKPLKEEEDPSTHSHLEDSEAEDTPPNETSSSDDELILKSKRTRRKLTRTSRKVKVIKRRRKSSIDYSEADVLSEIAECESYMTDIKHRTCIHCDYEAPNMKSMWIHMPLKHKIEYPSWCKHCNVQTEDLHKHRDSVRCFEDPCKFCKTICPNKNVLMKHLESHCENNTINETKRKTNKQFSSEEVKKALEESTSYMTDLKHRTCLYCSRVAARAKTLAVHLKYRHRDRYDTWCSRCNLQTDDLKTHFKNTKCFECICPLCDKKYNRINRLTIHIKSHCRDGFVEEEEVKNNWDEDDEFNSCFEEQPKRIKMELGSSDDEDVPTPSAEDVAKPDNAVVKRRSINRPLRRIPRQKVQKMLTGSLKSFHISKKYPHIARNKNDLQIYCLLCKKKIRSIKCHNLTKHKTFQIKKKRSPASTNRLCVVCGKIFKNNQILKVHLRICTGEKAFKCSFCEKLLPNKTTLQDHERRHTGEKPFVCHVCGRGFVSNGEQKQHMKIHEGGPVTCTICNKEFNRPGVLALHMKRHTGENPYKCLQCGMSYHIASLLKNHMRSHSNERPYKCSFCDKDFSCKSTMRKHENVHKGIKPYKCSVCSFSCTQAHGLSSHMKQHPEDPPLPDRPYKCLFCYRQFDTNAMLMSHTNNQHGEQTAQK